MILFVAYDMSRRVRVRVSIATTLSGNSILLESYQAAHVDISIKDSKYIEYRESIHNIISTIENK
jgi:hypothetical protein